MSSSASVSILPTLTFDGESAVAPLLLDSPRPQDRGPVQGSRQDDLRHKLGLGRADSRNERLSPSPGAIDVCLTADIEFDINGSFAFPERQDPVGSAAVFREVDGVGQGLDAMLSPLKQHGLPATFFIEVLQSHYFGMGPMSAVVDRISSFPGHDVEMHIHPCWRFFKDSNWRNRIKTTRCNDSMAGTAEEAEEIVEDALSVFNTMVGRNPIAVRTGNLSIDLRALAAFKKLGIPISSSVGIGYQLPQDKPLQLYGGVSHFGGISEIPVFSFHQVTVRGVRRKLFTLTGTSFPLAQKILLWAASRGVSPIVILTHAHEFSDKVQPHRNSPTYRPNIANQKKWQSLCQFLGENRKQFNVTTLSAMHDRGHLAQSVAPIFKSGPMELFRKALSLYMPHMLQRA